MAPYVLIIDDEEFIRTSSSLILSKAGFSVEVADGFANAKPLIDKNDYDVVFLDVLMPKVSGIDVLEYIKTVRPDTVVIIVTGNPSKETNLASKKLGAFDYLTKPVHPEALIQAAVRAHETKKLIKEKRELEAKSKIDLNKQVEEFFTSNPIDEEYTKSGEFQSAVGDFMEHRKKNTKKISKARERLQQAVKDLKENGDSENA